MTERRGGGPLLSKPTTRIRKKQQATRRRRGVLAVALGLLLVAVGAQGAMAGTAVAPHLALPAGNTPSGGHDHGGAAPSPTPGATSSTDSGHGTEHSADSHVDLPESGQEWTLPNLVAEGALVRVETVADVYVALHHYHVEKYSYTDVSDPTAVASGTFVNTRGLVITSKSALHDTAEQIQRFGTYGVNQAFVDAQFLKKLPADPFRRTTITAKNKGKLADTAPVVPEINDRLQSCYDWETSEHCGVFVVMHQRIMPSVQDSKTQNLEGLPLSDNRVAALSTQLRGVTPLTLQLANPVGGTKYWVVSSRGVNEKPLVGTGTLTDSEQAPISAADLAKWSKQFGELAEGAPVISARGDLVAFLGTAEGSSQLAAVSSSHMANDLRTFGLTRDSSPIDAQFQDGLELFEASQFAAAVPKLKAAVAASGGQRVARQLLAQSEQKSGTADDLSDEADLLSSPSPKSDGWSTLAIALFSALVILVLIIAGIAIALARRRRWPDGDDPGRAVAGDEPDDTAGGGVGRRAGRADARPGAGIESGADAGAGTAPRTGAGIGIDAGSGVGARSGINAGVGAGAELGTGDLPRSPVSAEIGQPEKVFAPISSTAAGPEATPNGHRNRPTALFATGTTDPRPAPQQVRRADPATDPGEAPTEKRASGHPGGPAGAAGPSSLADPGPRSDLGRAGGPSRLAAPGTRSDRGQTGQSRRLTQTPASDRPEGLNPTPGAAPQSPIPSRPSEPDHQAEPRPTTPSTRPSSPDLSAGQPPSAKIDPAGQPDRAGAPGQPATPKRPDAPQRPSGQFCRQCGAQLSPGDRFCFSCGTPASSPAGKG